MAVEDECSVWAIVAQKGGVGKTALTRNLAIMAAHAGFKVAVFDLDPQHSAVNWFADSKRSDVTAIPVLRFELERKIKVVKKAGANLVIIDTPPRSDEDAQEAIKAADLVLMPLTDQYDGHTATRTTAALALGARKQAHIILNHMPYPHHIKLRADALEAAQKFNLPIFKTEITRSDNFEYATRSMMAVTEYAPSSRAAIELMQLFNDICNIAYNFDSADCVFDDVAA